jgi:acetyl esterase/lipase
MARFSIHERDVRTVIGAWAWPAPRGSNGMHSGMEKHCAGRDCIEEDVEGLPPILILHGDADTVVPVSFAHTLQEAVVAAGGEAELQIYRGAGHSFNAPFSSGCSATAADDAHRQTIKFLRRSWSFARQDPSGESVQS